MPQPWKSKQATNECKNLQWIIKINLRRKGNRESQQLVEWFSHDARIRPKSTRKRVHGNSHWHIHLSNPTKFWILTWENRKLSSKSWYHLKLSNQNRKEPRNAPIERKWMWRESKMETININQYRQKIKKIVVCKAWELFMTVILYCLGVMNKICWAHCKRLLQSVVPTPYLAKWCCFYLI